MLKRIGAACGMLWLAMAGLAAAEDSASRLVRCDSAGVLRWADDDAEVALYGVNYYPPHLYDFYYLKQLGLSHEEAIDRDLAHFVRLGFTTIRLHVFDREVSDAEGNLVDNEHLQLLDYLIARAKERGIYTVVTPIAWWASLVPNAGFSNRFTMYEMTTDPRTREAQCRYLTQFLRHVNRYTHVAYKDEPAIPVVELINEPLYPENTNDAQVVEYIDTLAAAVRAAGCAKPLFYNGWQGRHGAVRDSRIDGISFNWYPTGLCAMHELTRNFLPKVAQFALAEDPALANKARIVYEFDAADVERSYMYPAMARGFREGGIQIAAQFQYDPLPLAATNVGWHTHYLNLVHTPRKALSMAIAAEEFRRLPRGEHYGPYPDNSRFGPFRISVEDDLSELAAEDTFIHTNSTQTAPPKPDQLEHIAGCGNSPIARYAGSGAYFLDKIAHGIWRLEVYPDVIRIANPFATTALKREVSRLYWRAWPFCVRLPDLGERFRATPLNPGNDHAPQVENATLLVKPGVYLLTAGETEPPKDLPEMLGRIRLREYVVPPPSKQDNAIVQPCKPGIQRGATAKFRVQIAKADPPKAVVLHYAAGDHYVEKAMERCATDEYVCQIPGEGNQTFKYYVTVDDGQSVRVYPADVPADEMASRLQQNAIEILYSASHTKTPDEASGQHGPVRFEVVEADPARLRLTSPGFSEKTAGSVRLPIDTRFNSQDISPEGTLVVRARSLHSQTSAFELGLVEGDGAAHGTNIPLTPAWRDIRVPLKQLLPLWQSTEQELRLDRVAKLSFVLGAWLYDLDAPLPHGFEVASVGVERRPLTWELSLQPDDGPYPLFEAETAQFSIQTPLRHVQRLVGGMDDRMAVQLRAPDGFGPTHGALSLRLALDRDLNLPGDASAWSLHVRARAMEPTTPALEVVLEEEDGSPWGVNLSLKPEWQEIVVPLSQLTYYKHWQPPSKSRGGADDRLHLQQVFAVTLCFGAWQSPKHEDEPHGVEIESITLVKTPQTDGKDATKAPKP